MKNLQQSQANTVERSVKTIILDFNQPVSIHNLGIKEQFLLDSGQFSVAVDISTLGIVDNITGDIAIVPLTNLKSATFLIKRDSNIVVQ